MGPLFFLVRLRRLPLDSCCGCATIPSARIGQFPLTIPSRWLPPTGGLHEDVSIPPANSLIPATGPVHAPSGRSAGSTKPAEQRPGVYPDNRLPPRFHSRCDRRRPATRGGQ